MIKGRMITPTGIALFFVLLLLLISSVMGRRIPVGSRMPMQWGVSGEPTWFASKRMALLFAPLIAIFTFLVTLLPAALFSASNPKVLDMLSPITILIGISFTAIHWLVLRRGRNYLERG